MEIVAPRPGTSSSFTGQSSFQKCSWTPPSPTIPSDDGSSCRGWSNNDLAEPPSPQASGESTRIFNAQNSPPETTKPPFTTPKRRHHSSWTRPPETQITRCKIILAPVMTGRHPRCDFGLSTRTWAQGCWWTRDPTVRTQDSGVLLRFRALPQLQADDSITWAPDHDHHKFPLAITISISPISAPL